MQTLEIRDIATDLARAAKYYLEDATKDRLSGKLREWFDAALYVSVRAYTAEWFLWGYAGVRSAPNQARSREKQATFIKSGRRQPALKTAQRRLK